MPTFDPLITSYLHHCKYAKSLSDKTLEAYRGDLGQFVFFLRRFSAYVKFSSIDKNLLLQYLQDIQQSFKPKTVRRKVASLKAFFNFLELEDMISVSPFRKLRIRIKEPFILPRVLTLEEVKRLLRGAYRALVAANGSAPLHQRLVRDVAVLELLFATGIRVSELCGLSIDAVDLDASFITVYGKGRKERVIQICTPDIVALLKRYKTLYHENENSEHFFLNKMRRRLSEQSVRLIVKRYASSVGLSRVTPHVFRHTFATLLLEQGVDIKYIQQLLGHASILTTQIYTHVSKRKQKEILLKKHPRIGMLLQGIST